MASGSASAHAAKTVWSNVFIAKRDANAVIRTDMAFALPRVVRRQTIDVDTVNQRVEVTYLGLFAKRYAQYREGRRGVLAATGSNAAMAVASAWARRLVARRAATRRKRRSSLPGSLAARRRTGSSTG